MSASGAKQPDGQISDLLSSPFRKNILLRDSSKSAF
jgi:hypothetical protein